MKRTMLYLSLIIIAAFIIRFIIVVKADKLLSYISPEISSVSSDSFDYNNHALNLLYGKSYVFGYPTVTAGLYRSPGYPFFLYFIFKFFGQCLLNVKIAQAVIDTISVFVIFLIGKELFNVKTGLLSSAIYTLYPYFLLQTAFILTETIFTFLFLVSIYFIVKILCGKFRTLDLLFGSFFIALACLTRSTVLPFMPAVLIWLIFSCKHNNFLIKRFVFLFLISLFFITPWFIYSFIVAKKPIAISTTGEVSLRVGNSEAGYRYYVLRDSSQNMTDYYTQDDSIRFIKETSNFIIKKPIVYFKYKYFNFSNFWRIVPNFGSNDFIRILINFVSVSLIPVFGLFGLYASFKAKSDKTVISFFLFSFIFFTIIHIISFGILRYRIPLIDPYLIIFFSFFILDNIKLKKVSL